MNLEFPAPDFGRAPKMSTKSISEGLMPSRDLNPSIDAREKGPPIVRMPPLRRVHTDSTKPESVVNLNTEPWILNEPAPSLEAFHETMALDEEFLMHPRRDRFQLHIVAYPRYLEDGGFDSESDSDYFCGSCDPCYSHEGSRLPKRAGYHGKSYNIERSPPSPSVRPSYFHFQGILLASSLDADDFFLFHTPIDPGKPRTHRTLDIHYSKKSSSSFPPPKKPTLSIPIATIPIHDYLENARLAAALSSVQPSKHYVHDALLALVSAGFIGEHLANACDKRMTQTISNASLLISRLEQSGYSLIHNNNLGIDIVIQVLVHLAQAGIDDMNKAQDVLNFFEEVREKEASGRYPTDDEGCTFSFN